MSDAAPDTQQAEGLEKCRHCGVQIIRINYTGGARWMHIERMNLYGHCSTTTAGPVVPPVITGQVPVSGNAHPVDPLSTEETP